MKEIVIIIAQALVDQPELVSVTEIGSRHTQVLELSVAKEDIGKIIGRQGRTASAIRTLLNAASGKTKKKTVLEIID